MTVNLAVVGLGAFGQKHLDALALIPDATIRYVAHSKMDVAQEVAAKYGAERAFTDYSELLAQEDLDGVLLATPTQMHHAQTIEALRAGKHVMVEIPMGDSLAGCARDRRRCKPRPAASRWRATRVASTPRTSTCTTRSRRASSRFSKWTCRPTSSGAPT